MKPALRGSLSSLFYTNSSTCVFWLMLPPHVETSICSSQPTPHLLCSLCCQSRQLSSAVPAALQFLLTWRLRPYTVPSANHFLFGNVGFITNSISIKMMNFSHQLKVSQVWMYLILLTPFNYLCRNVQFHFISYAVYLAQKEKISQMY